MVDCEVLPASQLLDSSGNPCERSPVVMDLDRIDHLLQASTHRQRQLKGKNVVDSVILPIQSIESNSSIPVSTVANLGARVNIDKKINLGVPQSVAPAALPTVSTPHTWASVAKGTSLHPLQFITPIYAADSNVIQIPNDLLELGRKKYSRCLIGQFMGKPPKLGLIQAMAAKLWGRQGPIFAAPYKEELYLFQFPTDSSLSRALHGGPWHIGGIPLFLRKWDVNIQPLDFSASIIPVWVHLKLVPFELMTKEGLSYLASAIGKPLHMNQDCSTLLSFDRVTVRIDVDYSKPLLNELVVALDGYTHKIEISYSWKSMHCDLCNKWGHHLLASSTKQPSTQWIPKAVPIVSLKPTVQSRMNDNPALPTNSVCATDTNNAPQPVMHDSGNSPSKLIPKVSAPISSVCTQTASNSSIEVNALNVPPTTSASEMGVNPSPKKPRKAAAGV
ncbi:hypothetical protein Tsubulata_015123 [Turnera subulata]|uniref:DUF4283 domain-containing protein n=1 Tax=Turnera subulata TaxID=218843 RepID=A0A9Q0IZT3_9ROSI|nr:hypothetical protein Tsubulata_015123 [Turnera subulata]